MNVMNAKITVVKLVQRVPLLVVAVGLLLPLSACSLVPDTPTPNLTPTAAVILTTTLAPIPTFTSITAPITTPTTALATAPSATTATAYVSKPIVPPFVNTNFGQN
jgi:hypothetical protein